MTPTPDTPGKLPPMRKGESGKAYARRLMMIVEAGNASQYNARLVEMVNRLIRPGSHLHARVLQTLLSRP